MSASFVPYKVHESFLLLTLMALNANGTMLSFQSHVLLIVPRIRAAIIAVPGILLLKIIVSPNYS